MFVFILDKVHSILDIEDLKLDKDYFRVEPILDCHQKESVQVSKPKKEGFFESIHRLVWTICRCSIVIY